MAAPKQKISSSFRHQQIPLIVTLILSVCILLLGLFGGISLLSKQTMPKPNTSSMASDKQAQLVTSLINQIQSEHEHDISISLAKPREDDTWWITNDGWNILVPTTQAFIVEVQAINERTPNKDAFAKLNTLVDNAVTKEGFTRNIQNSSKDALAETFSDPYSHTFYNYVQAYEHNDVKCVATSSPDILANSSAFSFSCFTNKALEQVYNEQLPFLKGLNDKDIAITKITLLQEDKARLDIRGREGYGAQALMYKADNAWHKIALGQEAPECSELQGKNIPPQYMPDCYDGNVIKKGNF